jgi:hypothetical protein
MSCLNQFKCNMALSKCKGKQLCSGQEIVRLGGSTSLLPISHNDYYFTGLSKQVLT